MSVQPLLLLALASLCILGVAQAREYHVSSSGDDRADGSRRHPWRTLDRANRQRMSPGERVLLRGGDVFRGSLTFDAQDAGTPDRPVTVGSYGGGRAVVLAGDGTAVRVWNCGGFVVRDLVLVGSGRETNSGSGVVFWNDLPGAAKLEHLRIESVSARGFGQYGIFVAGGPKDNSKSGYRDVRITRCICSDNALGGIYVTGAWDAEADGYANEQVVIARCVAHDNPGVPGHDNHSGNGILLEDTDGGLVDRCVAFQNGRLCDHEGGGPVGIWASSANRVVIQRCESHHNRTGPGSLDGGGFDLDGGVTNSILQFNYSHDNDGAGYLIFDYAGAPHDYRGNVVRYNISQNDGRRNGYAGIWAGGGIHDCEVYHNTVFVSPAPQGSPKALLAAGTRVRYRNNLLITTGGVPLVEGSDSPDLLLQGNCYWSGDGTFRIQWDGQTYHDLASWREATGQERDGPRETGFIGDPRLTAPGGGRTLNNPSRLRQLAAYTPRAASPLIDAGLDLGPLSLDGAGRRDFLGTPVPQGARPDVGAIEARRRRP